MQPIFITGIGTGIGKTLVSAIVTEALDACYWKPVQAGFADGTDSEWVGERISAGGSGAGNAGYEGRSTGEEGYEGQRPGNAGHGRIFPELYKLRLPASPHIAAREEGVEIDLDAIAEALPAGRPLVIEGAGGLLVPLNGRQFVLDLVKRLDATVVLVSRNYLGSINHSLLTAEVCRQHGLRVAGWIFNDQYLHYEQEIVAWSRIRAIGSVPFNQLPDAEFIQEQARLLGPVLREVLPGDQ